MSNPGDVALGTSKEGFNCAQAVLSEFAERFGMKREEALKVAAGMGGGIARLGFTCGAVTGGIMALGLAKGTAVGSDIEGKQRAYDLAQELVRRFKAKHGMLNCRELIGTEIDTKEKFEAARQSGALKNVCPGAIRSACEIVEELTGRG